MEPGNAKPDVAQASVEGGSAPIAGGVAHPLSSLNAVPVAVPDDAQLSEVEKIAKQAWTSAPTTGEGMPKFKDNESLTNVQTNDPEEADLFPAPNEAPINEGLLISEQALKSHPGPSDSTPSLQFPQALEISGHSNSSSYHVPLDVDTSDSDSAIGSMDFSSTQSARSSVYDFVEENGRKYHRFREGKYLIPNDEIEQDRLDLQHHLFGLTLGALYLAPVKEIKDSSAGLHRVLDFATGTGIWAIDFATEFPETAVTGMDLSPIQPAFVPPNCMFEVDDADDEWIYNHKFDYIHGRALAACFKSGHENVFRSAFNALRPGGYIEIQDAVLPMRGIDDTFPNSALNQWQIKIIQGSLNLGVDVTKVPKYKGYLESVGFVDVVERKFVWPLGTWPKGDKMKLIGSWAREDMLSAVKGGGIAPMTKGLGMSVEDAEAATLKVQDEMRTNKVHSYMAIHVLVGRKPE